MLLAVRSCQTNKTLTQYAQKALFSSSKYRCGNHRVHKLFKIPFTYVSTRFIRPQPDKPRCDVTKTKQLPWIVNFFNVPLTFNLGASGDRGLRGFRVKVKVNASHRSHSFGIHPAFKNLDHSFMRHWRPSLKFTPTQCN